MSKKILTIILLIISFALIVFGLLYLKDKNNKIQKITISEKNIVLENNSNYNFKILEENLDLYWQSSDSNVISINEMTGEAKALKEGIVVIRVSLFEDSNIYDTCMVEVKNSSVASLSEYKINLFTGETFELSVKNADNVTWNSENNNIASVNSEGIVTAKGVGTTTIHAIINDGEDLKCEVNVIKKDVEIETAQLNAEKITLEVGGKETISLVINPPEATIIDIKYSSDDLKVAAVDSNGNILAIGPGRTVINVLINNNLTIKCEVLVVKKDYDEPNIQNDQLYTQVIKARYENADGSWTEYSIIDTKKLGYNEEMSYIRKADDVYKEASIVPYKVTKDKIVALDVYRNVYKCVIKTRFQKESGTSYNGEIVRVNTVLRYGQECSWKFAGNENYQPVEFITEITSDIEETININRYTNSEEHALEICEGLKNETSLNYEQFRALSRWDNYKVNINGKTVFDDYYLIKATHDCANKYNKPVVLKEAKVYNIYKNYEEGKTKDSIEISTSTNFGNSTFYIHDETFTLKETSNEVKILDDGPIFSVKNSDSERKSFTKYGQYDYNKVMNTIKNNKSKYGDYVFVRLTNADTYSDGTSNTDTVFRRSGNHSDNFSYKTDSFRVKLVYDKNGNVKNVERIDNLFWDENDYKVPGLYNKGVIYKIPSNKLILQNGNFITVISSDKNKVEKLKNVSGNTSRNIAISRSNIEVSNMKYHYEKDTGEETDTLTYGYTGFYRFYDLADAVFKDSIIAVADGNANNKGNSIYGLVMSDVVNMKVENISMYKIKKQKNDSSASNNNYELTPDGKMKQLTDKYVLTNKNYWGVTGTNNCKKIIFDNVKLNRIDSHAAILDLTVKNSILGVYTISITGTGSGSSDYSSGNYQNDNILTIENVTVYSDRFIALRGDYGSTWNGTIKIKNGVLMPTDEQIDNNGNTYLLYWGPEVNNNTKTLRNYGYNLYLPYIVMENDFKIDNSNLNKKTVKHFYTYLQPKNYFESLKMVRDNKTYNYFVPPYTKIELVNKNITSSVFTD